MNISHLRSTVGLCQFGWPPSLSPSFSSPLRSEPPILPIFLLGPSLCSPTCYRLAWGLFPFSSKIFCLKILFSRKVLLSFVVGEEGGVRLGQGRGSKCSCFSSFPSLIVQKCGVNKHQSNGFQTFFFASRTLFSKKNLHADPQGVKHF